MLYNEVMAIQPDTDVYLLKCPIEQDQRNQLTFSTRTAQQTYFNSLPKISLDNFSYQRKDNVIRVPQHIDSIIGYNYVMYRNNNYTNRWFYAFITNMEYVNDNCTHVFIRTDVYQTWAMDITAKASYVEREHVNDDTVGLHTIPEGLDTGEYVCNDVLDYIYADPDSVRLPAGTGDLMVCAQVTTLKFNDNDYMTPPTYNIVNSIPQGCYVVAWPLSIGLGALNTLVGAYDAAGKGDAIVSMFIVPKSITPSWNLYTGHGTYAGNDQYYYPADTRNASFIDGWDNLGRPWTDGLNVAINTTLNGYTPKNNKLKVAPYNYFTITNNNGTDIEFYYEDFTSTPNFEVVGSFEQGCDIAIIPTNSKRTIGNGKGTGWTEAITAGRLPQVSWLSDFYLNWEAKNGKNVAIQTGLQAAGMALGVLNPLGTQAATHATGVDTAVQRGYFPDEIQMSVNAGGPLGSVINFASSVANTQNTIRQAKMVPAQAKGNSSSATLSYSNGMLTRFTARKMSVRAEYARAIDTYFSMFGYKVNTVKVPNFTGRANWNYVKTIGFNCVGDVPERDLQEYKNIFNNGVTLWHNPTTFMDYTQNNNIV